MENKCKNMHTYFIVVAAVTFVEDTYARRRIYACLANKTMKHDIFHYYPIFQKKLLPEH